MLLKMKRKIQNQYDIIDIDTELKCIQLLLDQVSIIIENAKEKKDLVFSIDNIKVFIQTSVELILAKLKELNIYGG